MSAHITQLLQRMDMVHKMKVQKRPHQAGTVAEIAQKLGISKSEVRRAKADGTLDAILEREVDTPIDRPRA